MLTFQFPALLSLAGLREDERASRRAIREEKRRICSSTVEDSTLMAGERDVRARIARLVNRGIQSCSSLSLADLRKDGRVSWRAIGNEKRTICRSIVEDLRLMAACRSGASKPPRSMDRGIQSCPSLACMIEEGRENLGTRDTRPKNGRFAAPLSKIKATVGARERSLPVSTGDPSYAGASGEFGTESMANAELWSWETEKESSASL